jgi:hypothetical protein
VVFNGDSRPDRKQDFNRGKPLEKIFLCREQIDGFATVNEIERYSR